MPTLLVVDDERAILHAFRRVFHEPEFQLVTAERGDQGLALAKQSCPDVVILDVRLPDMTGLEVYEALRVVAPKTPVILITGHGTTTMAIEAMQRGAYDYLLKPLELGELRRIVAGACAVARAQRVAPLFETDTPTPPGEADVLIGLSPRMNEVYKAIGRVARQEVSVLLTGESGTGKELVARAIYHHSHRSGGPFQTVHCAAIPEVTLMSELFGHEQGAFPGADQMRIGKLEQCAGGTIFLDEIGELSPALQARLLRLLEKCCGERLGSDQSLATDVRLLAATHHNLEELVAAGDFREDLFFRLNECSIALPPLRERGDDLPRLVYHFAQRFARELGKELHDVAPDTLQLLAAYAWPGNVRELQSVLKQTLLQATGSVLIPEFLPPHIRTSPASAVERADGSFNLSKWDAFIASRLRDDSQNLYEEATLLTDHHLLMLVLRHTQGNQLQAARILGISRATLRTKLRALKIRLDDVRW